MQEGADILPAFLSPNGETGILSGQRPAPNFLRGPVAAILWKTAGTEPGRYTGNGRYGAQPAHGKRGVLRGSYTLIQSAHVGSPG